MNPLSYIGEVEPFVFDLYVQGEIPALLAGSLIVPTNRRNKDRQFFSRWHDSQTDLIRLDLYPGRPGRVQAHILAVDPSGADLGNGFRRGEFERRAYGQLAAYGYATQPNHGVTSLVIPFGQPTYSSEHHWR